jgi:SAM-dependent methyltransferase
VSLLDKVHGGFVSPRRIGRLAQKIAELVPAGARILDVGCGDGRVAFEVSKLRPDVRLEGIDVLIRKETLIPVTRFDGERIPYEDASFDVVMLIDVLHHANDPQVLLREAKRVARQAVVIKDHTRAGFLAGPRLRFMDWVGNARHGVVLPYNYWSRNRWHSELKNLGLVVDQWSEKLHLYPWWANWLFGCSLHFIARLKPASS